MRSEKPLMNFFISYDEQTELNNKSPWLTPKEPVCCLHFMLLSYSNSKQLHEGEKKLLLDLKEQSLKDISEMAECETKEKCRQPFYFRKQR